MKKILTALCAASLALGLAVTAFAAPEGEANFALGAVGGPAIIVAPNTYYNPNGSGELAAILAFDGDDTTRWGAPQLANNNGELTDDCFLGLDYGATPVTFDKVTIEWEQARAAAAASGGFVLEYSNDGSQWTSVATDKITRQEIKKTVNGEESTRWVDTATLDAPVTARFVRVNIQKLENAGKDTPSIWDLQIFNTTVDADDNLALVQGKTVYTVSTQDDSTNPSNAFDDNPNSGWKLNQEASQDDNQAWILNKDEYIGVRFAELKTVGHVVMTWPNNYNPRPRSQSADAYVLQITKDGVTWEDVEANYNATYTEVQDPTTSNYTYTVSFDETAVLGVRVSIHEVGNENYPQLNSFEVYQNAESVISKYYVTVDNTITGGAVLATTNMVAEGETVEVTVIPDQGYQLKAGSLKANDVEITEQDGVYSFVMPGEAVTITAEFEKISSEDPVYQVEIAETTGGTISVDKTEGPWGTEIIVTVTPDEGLELKELRANGTLIRPTDGVYSFHMPASNVTLTAVFGEPGVDPDPDDPNNPGGTDPDDPNNPGGTDPDVPGTGVASVTAIVLLAGGSAAGVAISRKRKKD